MVTSKARTIAEVIGIIALMASLGVVVSMDQAKDNIYNCATTNVDMYCHKLSATGKYCYFNPEAPTKYKTCKVAWAKLTVDSPVVEPTEVKQYICNFDGCIDKN